MSNCIGNFSELVNVEQGKDFLIFGSAATVKHFKNEIISFIKENSIKTIGINKMTHIYTPDYHAWTNNQRLRDFGDCINPNSVVIFGNGLKEENKNKWNVKYYHLDYCDYAFGDKMGNVEYKNKRVYGYFRICGNMAIYLAHLMGARNIYCVGMDGYSKPYKGDQHCYGKGLTDLHGSGLGKVQDMKYEEEKDNFIYKSMKEIAKAGVKFSIITPTIYEDFYDESILANNTKS